MTGNIEERPVAGSDYWREKIAEQERSEMSVRQFCKEQGIAEHSYYYWRKRLRDQQKPMRFALVETGAARQESATEACLELVLASSERLRISTGVDATTLRTVLEVFRG